MSSAIRFSLDQSKILSAGNGLSRTLSSNWLLFNPVKTVFSVETQSTMNPPKIAINNPWKELLDQSKILSSGNGMNDVSPIVVIWQRLDYKNIVQIGENIKKTLQ